MTVSGCQCNAPTIEEETIDVDTLKSNEQQEDTFSLNYQPEFAFYYLEYNEETGEDEIVVQEVIQPEMDEEFIQQRLNLTYPKVQISEINLDSDSILNVYIEDATYLTQQMGSYGAQEYLLHAVFAFTSIEKIKAVHFHFKEGDHAEPKLYFREDFKQYLKN